MGIHPKLNELKKAFQKNEELNKALKSNKKMSEIADKLGISKHNIYYKKAICEKNKVQLEKKIKRMEEVGDRFIIHQANGRNETLSWLKEELSLHRHILEDIKEIDDKRFISELYGVNQRTVYTNRDGRIKTLKDRIERIEHYKEQYEEGLSLEEIGKKEGITRERIRQHLKFVKNERNDYEALKKTTQVRKKKKAAIMNYINNNPNKTLDVYVADLPYNKQTIREAMKELGVEIKTKKEIKREERNRAIIELSDKGLSDKVIAEKLETSRSNVGLILMEKGNREPRRLTGKAKEKRDKLLIQDYKNGMTQEDMMSKYRLSVNSVAMITKSVSRNKRQLNARDKRLYTAYKKGVTCNLLDEKYGLSSGHAERIVARMKKVKKLNQ